jgi:phosphohistidine phosphatase SixA
MRSRFTAVLFALMAVALVTSTGLHGRPAQVLTGPDLVAALRSGGLVIVMRHASSPRQPPAKEAAQPDNVTLERQLDAAGRASATAMGEALRRLKIPVGDVLTSPTFRARETVRYAQLGNAKAFDELGDGGQSMQGAAEKQGAWLREKAAASPRGTNTILVTHMPNIARAFPDIADVADGESLVFRPDGKGGSSLIGRIPIDAWGALR